MTIQQKPEGHPNPHEVLGVPEDADTGTIRAAYIRKVQENPPDRSPEEFERIRDAYRFLTDPRRRAREHLLSGDPLAPMASILGGAPSRQFVGPERWLRVLKGSAS